MPILRRFFYYVVLPFIAGTFYALGFPQKEFPYHMICAHLGVFLLFFQLFHVKPLKKQLLSLLCYSLGYNLVGYYWIPETLKEFGNIGFPLNYILATSFSLIILPHFFIYLLLCWFLNKKYAIQLKPLANAFILTMLEYFVPQQFPAHLGHSWLELSPYLGLTPLFGVSVYGLISYYFIFSLLDYIHHRKRPSFAAALILIASLVTMSTLMPLPKPGKELLRIRLVQGNIGNMLKLNSEKGYLGAEKAVFERYKNLSLTQGDGAPPRLLVWPETAYPELLMTKYMTSTSSVPSTIREVTTLMNAYLFTGGYDRADQNAANFFESQYNSGLFFSPEAKFLQVYHKTKLIPFGESLPFGPLNKYLINLNPNIAFFAQGKTKPIFTIDERFHFISAICYEVLFSSYVRDYLNRVTHHPHFMINITNDSWYGDTAEPYQHKYLAHWRALEFQIPIIRMTNTGISNILYQDGSESQALTHNMETILDLDLKLGTTKPTLYQRYGIMLLMLLTGILYLAHRSLKALFHQIVQAKKS